jgi:3-isopropylmalate dehydrogenase
LKESVAKGVDFIVVRELIGGLYFGDRKELASSVSSGYAPTDAAFDTMIYSVGEVERITRVAAQIALASNPPLSIHSIDKANVLASSRLWRKIVTATIEREYPQLAAKLDHQLVDSAAMVMVANPRKLNGVILTENMFGDMYVSIITMHSINSPLRISVSPTRVASSLVPWAFFRRPL